MFTLRPKCATAQDLTNCLEHRHPVEVGHLQQLRSGPWNQSSRDRQMITSVVLLHLGGHHKPQADPQERSERNRGILQLNIE